jgi:hypothetical protein
VKFFLLAVFATMYVRDHQRPHFHEALGIEPTEYGYKVFKITSEISRQVFPLELDIDNPAFFAGLEKLRKINDRSAEWQKKGGMTAKIGKARTVAAAAFTFLRLYLLPSKTNALPRPSGWSRHGDPLLMDYALPIAYALPLVVLDRHDLLSRSACPVRTFKWSMAGATALLGLSLYVIWRYLGTDTSHLGCLCQPSRPGLLAWGWQEISLYTGFVTGPRKHRCPRAAPAGGTSAMRSRQPLA